MQGCSFRKGGKQEMLLQTVGLTNLSLCTIPVNCLPKLLFRHTDEHFHARTCLAKTHTLKQHPQGKCDKSHTLTTEEGINLLL